MTKSESIKEIAAALAKAQAGIRNASQDKTNPAFKSKYADLSSVWEACRSHLSANGIAVAQGSSADGPKVTVTTLLMHSSGEWLSCDLSVNAVKGDPQGIGSAITYARRYGLSSMVGVAPGDDIADEGDDDGNQASGKAQPEATKAAAQISLAKRKADALAFLRNKLGETETRKGLAQVLGRTFPVADEIKFHNETELGIVEAWVELNRSTQP
jgi:hypothetical protein